MQKVSCSLHLTCKRSTEEVNPAVYHVQPIYPLALAKGSCLQEAPLLVLFFLSSTRSSDRCLVLHSSPGSCKLLPFSKQHPATEIAPRFCPCRRRLLALFIYLFLFLMAAGVGKSRADPGLLPSVCRKPTRAYHSLKPSLKCRLHTTTAHFLLGRRI